MGLDILSIKYFIERDFALGLIGRNPNAWSDEDVARSEDDAVFSIAALSTFFMIESAHTLIKGFNFPSFNESGYPDQSSSLDALLNYVSKPRARKFLEYVNKSFWKVLKTRVPNAKKLKIEDILDAEEFFESYNSNSYLVDIFRRPLHNSKSEDFPYELTHCFNHLYSDLSDAVKSEMRGQEVQAQYILVDHQLLHLIALSRIPNMSKSALGELFGKIDKGIETDENYTHHSVYGNAKREFIAYVPKKLVPNLST